MARSVFLLLACVAYSMGAYIKLPVELEMDEFTPQHDVLAQAACTGLAYSSGAGGWVYAVRRRCAAGSPICETVCADPALKAQDSQVASKSASCINALHVYKDRPQLSSTYGQDTNKLGLKVYKYNRCNWESCGPNYCCCGFQ